MNFCAIVALAVTAFVAVESSRLNLSPFNYEAGSYLAGDNLLETKTGLHSYGWPVHSPVASETISTKVSAPVTTYKTDKIVAPFSYNTGRYYAGGDLLGANCGHYYGWPLLGNSIGAVHSPVASETIATKVSAPVTTYHTDKIVAPAVPEVTAYHTDKLVAPFEYNAGRYYAGGDLLGANCGHHYYGWPGLGHGPVVQETKVSAPVTTYHSDKIVASAVPEVTSYHTDKIVAPFEYNTGRYFAGGEILGANCGHYYYERPCFGHGPVVKETKVSAPVTAYHTDETVATVPGSIRSTESESIQTAGIANGFYGLGATGIANGCYGSAPLYPYAPYNTWNRFCRW